MEDQVKVKRFEKLKSMRDALCEREKTRAEKAAHQKWLHDQMQELFYCFFFFYVLTLTH